MYCFDCKRWFPSVCALVEHYSKSPLHHYCAACSEHFCDADDLEDHYDYMHSGERCVPCNRTFRNAEGLHQHYRQSPVHSSRYCAPCKRLFQSENNLNAHLNSSVHRTKDIPCACGLLFVSNAALLLHLEAGTCRTGIKRSHVNDFVKSRDTTNIITNPARMITGTTTTYYATGAAWNGYAYECYLCPREFGTLASLNQHLASPKHEAKMYRCPLSSCLEQFSTLSGLCQHIESRKCNVIQQRAVKNVMDNMVSGMKRLTM